MSNKWLMVKVPDTGGYPQVLGYNGPEIVTMSILEDFIDWIRKNRSQCCQVSYVPPDELPDTRDSLLAEMEAIKIDIKGMETEKEGCSEGYGKTAIQMRNISKKFKALSSKKLQTRLDVDQLTSARDLLVNAMKIVPLSLDEQEG